MHCWCGVSLKIYFVLLTWIGELISNCFFIRILIWKSIQMNLHLWVVTVKISPLILINHAILKVCHPFQLLRPSGVCHYILLYVQRSLTYYQKLNYFLGPFNNCSLCSVIFIYLLKLTWFVKSHWQKHSLFRQIFAVYGSASKAVKQV